MSFKMRLSFARKSFVADRLLQIPYLVAMGLMFSLFLMVHGLITTPFVQGFSSLVTLMQIGLMVVAILVFVFAVYANRFLMRRRNTEFALYGILGLEKKHITGILAIEACIQAGVIFLIGVVGGFLLNKLSLQGVVRILNLQDVSKVQQPLPLFSALIMLMFLVAVFLFIFLRNVAKINVRAPLNLLAADRKAEAEPKAHPIRMILGFLLVGFGYAISCIVQSPISSVLLFFPAVLAVIVGTYFLFTSFSIWYLKKKKETRNYYEDPATFLSTSGMLFRMKSHATGLASIAILLTGILVTLVTTTTLVGAIDNRVKEEYPTAYKADYRYFGEKRPTEKQILQKIAKEEKAIKESSFFKSTDRVRPMITASFQTMREGNQFTSAASGLVIDYVQVMPLATYQELGGKGDSLAPGEVLVLSDYPELKPHGEIRFGDQTFRIAGESTLKKPSNIAANFVQVIVSDYQQFLKVGDGMNDGVMQGDANGESVGEATMPILLSLGWNGELKTKDFSDRVLTSLYKDLDQRNPEGGFIVSTRESAKRDYADFYGGFLFLGLTVTILFLVGTVLVTYFKQVAEAWEDRRQFSVMQEVGLPRHLIKKTTRKQILWLFFLPLGVALVHTVAASPILTKLLLVLGMADKSGFYMFLLIIMAVLSGVYLLLFQSTSFVYNRIVSE